MATRGQATRDRILETAENIILRQGYSGTSIDDILEGAHITKGGFFYHFKGKNDLAVGLMERYRIADRELFTGLVDQARDLVEDPLQQFLLFLKLLADAMANLPDVHPGCLIATFTYESEKVNEDVRQINREVILEWRQIFKSQLDLVDQKYTKRLDADNDSLADALTSIIEGGIVVSKALEQQPILPNQILHFRDHIRLLYDVC